MRTSYFKENKINIEITCSLADIDILNRGNDLHAKKQEHDLKEACMRIEY